VPAAASRSARLAATAAIAAAATLLIACGSSSGSSGTSGNSGGGGGSLTAGGTGPCAGKAFGAPLQPKDAPSDAHKYSAAPPTQIDSSKLYLATITTKRGDIVLCLQPSIAPKTVNVFTVLARNRFFDGLTFHRVVAQFVIQGGDPTGNGSGGPGFSFADEPVQGDYTAGCVAMANAGPNTNGSQFFICIADDTTLPKQYNLFGSVDSGLDVAKQIQQGDVMQTVVVREQQ
jgi:cyclophilin family peptidyl-prolyl cis-trans isomerase